MPKTKKTETLTSDERMAKLLAHSKNKMLECLFCSALTAVASDTGRVLCGQCVAKLSDAPVQPTPYVEPAVKLAQREERKAASRLAKAVRQAAAGKTKGRGRGWHLKRHFEYEGKTYSFGVEVK